ncbi:MAG: hypothetical protein IJ537_02525 [Bacteroidaceae bacterium]|nr:hypothetical protein [Bacteroidaceae bacterium]
MKRILYFIILLLSSMYAGAQRISVVDDQGNGIHLVTVLTEDGNMIGITNLEGMTPDLGGAAKIVLTHVAFKPKLVDVASVKGGKVTMEDLDYNLAEIVVKPKPLIYVETFYRVYGFADNSLRYYLAGIMPNTYDVEKKKIKSGSYNQSYGEFSISTGASITWGARAQEFNAGKLHKGGAIDFVKGGKARDHYFVTVTDEGKGRQRVSNPEGTVGFIETEKDEVHMTLDAGKMQMYRNKRLGQNWQLKGREKAEYAYEFNVAFNLDEDGNATMADLVMSSDHWEWNGSKGRMKFIIETYAVEHAYIDAKDFKEKKKELKKKYVALMNLDDLEAYATSHHIPALTPTIRRAIEGLKK